MKKIKITGKEAGARVDKFLVTKLKDLNRSQVQKLVKRGGVFLNGKEAMPGHIIKAGDLIEIGDQKSPEEIEPNPKLKKPAEKKFSLEVIAETDEYMIINKPAGLTMHGGNSPEEVTLATLLLKYYPKIKKVGEDSGRPGIVHRLDKEVSGLVVVAKTQRAFENLKKQFQDRTILKEYTALVFGQVPKAEDTILFPIRRSRQSQRMAALPLSEEEDEGELEAGVRTAITEFKTLKGFINYTLLKVRIKTGRTHQIRVHMLAYGHPIVGDNLYGTAKTRDKNKKINLGRVFLFADRLSFKDLAGEQKTFTLEMPEELKKFYKEVK